MPEITPLHRQLARLAGRWTGEETMFPSDWDPAGGVAIGRNDTRVALDGLAVVSDYEQERDGKVTFRGHGVWILDGESGDCLLHWFDSLGMGLEVFRGGFDGDVLTARSRNPMGHARLTWDLRRDGEIGSRMETSPDGERWSSMFEAVYRREG